MGVNAGADEDEIRRLCSDVDAVIFDARVESSYGSENHGACLDRVFERISTTYAMLVDCDIAFIEPNWDSLMLAKLNDRDVIVGAEYDGQKYKRFPNVIGAMFETRVLKDLNISFMPEGRTTLHDENLHVYGYDGNEPVTIILDTGSELPRKIKAAGYNGVPMPIFRSGAEGAVFMDGIRGEEYQLDGSPIFTHLGRSYTRVFGVDEHAIAWEKKVRQWIDHRKQASVDEGAES